MAFGGTNAVDSGAAMQGNTTGSSNVAIGNTALPNNTTGSFNVAIGRQTLVNNTTASNNTAVGYQAGYTNVTGAGNAFFGTQAGYLSTGSYNAFLGAYAGYNSTGSGNTFVGINSTTGNGAGYNMTTGSDNTILGGYNGNQGGLDIRTASNYIVLSDGDGNPRGYFGNSAFGEFYLNATAAANYSGILNFASATSVKAQIYHDTASTNWYYVNGSGGVYLANGGTSWTSASDERLKNITGEIQNGLNKVCSLRAAEYTWKSDESAKSQVGLIAQDVLAVLPQAVQTPPEGSTNRDGSPAMMGVSYTDTIPLLVAAIKELKAEVDSLKQQLGK